MRDHTPDRRWIGLGLALLLGILCTAPRAQDAPVHLGVASCAASTCHGRVDPARHDPVARNEYFIWSKYDQHSQAYNVLKGKRSRRIATNMGLGDPARAHECLVCHSDDVPVSQRGPKFHLSDGVGCEACHGGAENWIDSHTNPDTSHADNLDRGMHPTDKPVFQARMCQACHVGDKNRLATHEMMAAGHPRLYFELDTWLANMPPHHVVDADYRRRKGATAHADRWAAGVVAQSRAYLGLLLQHVDGHGLTPELALFDCNACHQRMNPTIQRTLRQRGLIQAGALRPAGDTLQILAILVRTRNQELSRRIEANNQALYRAASQSVAAFRRRVSALRAVVDHVDTLFAGKPLSAGERGTLRIALLRAAAAGYFHDYAHAQQMYLALQVLATQAGNAQRYDRLFALLDDENSFDPNRVAAQARRLLADSAGK